MEFQLKETVLYNDEKHTVYDYNARHKEYTLLSNEGSKVYAVPEEMIFKINVRVNK